MRCSRRSFVRTSALTLSAWATGCAGAARGPRAGVTAAPPRGPIAIVPGTGAGTSAYARLTRALSMRGRHVYPIALAGMGERVAEIRPEIDDNFHAQEVADFLIARDLRGVTLVGHSYGGFPITGAVGRARDRIRALVYLDAYVPKNGDSLFSMDPKLAELIQKRADAEGEGWKIPPFPAKQFMNTESDVKWFEANVTVAPLAMFKTPLVVDPAAFAKVKKGYVAYTQYKFFQHQGEALERGGGKYRVVMAGHMGVYLAPEATADAILAVEA